MTQYVYKVFSFHALNKNWGDSAEVLEASCSQQGYTVAEACSIACAIAQNLWNEDDSYHWWTNVCTYIKEANMRPASYVVVRFKGEQLRRQ